MLESLCLGFYLSGCGWKDLFREGVWGKAADDTTFPVWPLQRNIFRPSMSAELRGEATYRLLSLIQYTHTQV